MERRALLAAVGGTIPLAGCIASRGSVSRESTASSDDRRTVSLSTDSVPNEADVALTARLDREEITPSETARLEVTTKNTGERRRLSPGTEGCGLFNRSLGTSDPRGVFLRSHGAKDSIDRDGDRWRRDLDPDTELGFDGYGCSDRVYENEESRSVDYFVWDDFRTDGYLNPGTYRFDAPVTVRDVEFEVSDDPLARFEWGLELTVSK